jgi:beta-lactam-binding protein with PASTA domain
MSILFESFMVFYLIEVVVLVSTFIWYYKEPKKQEVKVVVEQKKAPTASEIIKLRNLQKQISRGI